jgi:hypothetical protein
VNADGHFEPANPVIAYADADFTIHSAVMHAIVNSLSSVMQQLPVSCSSSQCNFPEFTSLAVCSRCVDLTPRLARNSNSTGSLFARLQRNNPGVRAGIDQTEFRLPNGLYINNLQDSEQQVWLTMSGTSNAEKTVSMKQLDTLIWSQSIIRTKNFTLGGVWPDVPVEASECALYYCVKKFTASIQNGTLMETSSTLSYRRSPDSWRFNDGENYQGLSEATEKSVAFHPVNSWPDRSDLQLTTSSSQFNISQSAVEGIGAFMQKTFTTCLNFTGKCNAALDDRDTMSGFFTYSGVSQYEPSVARVFWESDRISSIFESVAASITNAIRTGADVGENSTVVGSVGMPTVIYAIAWPWIALHCIVELGTVIVLIVTAWALSRYPDSTVPSWKSSSLATLSINSEAFEVFRGSMTIDDLETRARSEVVAFLR